MSGIFGIINVKGGPVERQWLEGMRANLAHRGPDGGGIYHKDTVGIGHLLLQVSPESKYEHSPCQLEGLVVSADARLDAREALMDQLRIDPERRLTLTDPELIALAYRKWGEDCVEHLLGDFAFAIWDEKEKKLFCARDHVGAKQFFYAFQGDLFIFSSELKAIVALQLFPTGVDQRKLIDCILWIDEQPEDTYWFKVKRLLGARSLTLHHEQLQLKRYWDLKHHHTLQYQTLEEYGLQLKRLLEEAIADRLRTDHEIGVPLSGGLDSSSIACIAARMLQPMGKHLFTTSSVLSPDKKESGISDEMDYIQAVLEQEPNIKAGFVYSNQHHYISGVEKKFDRHYTLANLWHDVDEAVFEDQSKKKVRRLLSGFFGDCTVSNSSIYPLPILLSQFKWRTFLKLVRQLRQNTHPGYFVILKKELILPILSFKLYKLWFVLNKKPFPWGIHNLPIDEQEQRMIQDRIEKKYQSEGYFTHPDLYQNIWTVDQNWLPEEWDCSVAHYNLEITYPLLDKRIIEFLYQLPAEVFNANGFKRGLIRLAMKDVLPDKVLYRQNKGHYSPGFYVNLYKELPLLIHQLKQNTALIDDQKGLLKVKKAINMVSNLEKSLSTRTFDRLFWGSSPFVMGILFLIWVELFHNQKTKHEK